MLWLDEIRDPELLRQVAALLERENEKLHAKVQTLTAELARLQGDAGSLVQRELEFLKELLAQRERALFGASWERRPRPPAAEEAAPPAPRRGHGPTAQPRLPRVDVVHELAVPDQTCPQCGGTLTEMAGQTDDSEGITVVERRVVIVTHRRKKYRCRCNGCVEMVPGPRRLTVRPDVRGRRYAPEFAVEVAISKYLDHAPLERQARAMAREGLVIESRGRRRRDQRWWAWSLTCEDAVTYMIPDSRSQDAARQVLDGYRGIVVADGYGAYDALARAWPSFTLAHCWAHVHRKFVEAEPHSPGPCAEVLALIGPLYAPELAAPAADPGTSEEVRAAELAGRAQIRRGQSAPVVAAIHAWAPQQRALPKSSLAKAIASMLGLWSGLTRFLADPCIPLDNNATERALRGMVVGRKNHYGSRSQRGTEVAALFYSLIESAKLCGAEPKAYLLQATRA